MSTTNSPEVKPAVTTETASPAEGLLLDDLSLQKRTASYPAELREGVLWVGWYVREHCNRNLETLVERAKEVKVTLDKTSWSKVLRGKNNRDKDNQPLEVPIVNEAKLAAHIAKIREAHRLHEMAGKVPFVMTPTSDAIFNFVDRKRAPGTINRFGVIIGYTGTQKTATLKEYARRNNHGACVWMEMPENGSLTEFIKMLSTKYGGNYNESYGRARNRIFETLTPKDREDRFRTIILENCQGGYNFERGAKQPIYDFIRRVQEETQCAFILTFTPEFAQRLETEMALKGYFEQFEGRAGGAKGFLRLPDFPTDDDVLAIAQAFGLQHAEKHLPYLSAIAQERGRVRRLFEDLQGAKKDAEDAKQKLTIEHVRAFRGEEVE
jgi:DNA transposition AAA+ family ATPase